MSAPACERCRELSSAWLDERLEGQELLDLERHLSACEDCREFSAGLRRLRDLLRAAEALRPPVLPRPGFAAAVTARLGGALPMGRPAARPERPWRSLAGIAAAAAAAAVFLFWSWQRLLPGGPAATQVAVVERASPLVLEEGSIDGFLLQHAALAREATLLGPAEEVELASYPVAGAR